MLRCGHWRFHPPGQNRPIEVTFQFLLVVRPEIELSGRYSASKLRPALPRSGHDLPLISTPNRTPEGLDHSETSQPIYSSFSATAGNPLYSPSAQLHLVTSGILPNRRSKVPARASAIHGAFERLIRKKYSRQSGMGSSAGLANQKQLYCQ